MGIDSRHLGEMLSSISTSEGRQVPDLQRLAARAMACEVVRRNPDADDDTLRAEIRECLMELGVIEDPDTVIVNPLSKNRSRRGQPQ